MGIFDISEMFIYPPLVRSSSHLNAKKEAGEIPTLTISPPADKYCLNPTGIMGS